MRGIHSKRYTLGARYLPKNTVFPFKIMVTCPHTTPESHVYSTKYGTRLMFLPNEHSDFTCVHLSGPQARLAYPHTH
jgi:hypothetical protein